MILSFEQICSVTQGAAEIQPFHGDYFFFRMNPKQREYFAERGFLSHKITHTSAGIRLVFRTNSTHLSFILNTTDIGSRTFYHVEVYKDDQRIGGVCNAKDLLHPILFDGTEIEVDEFRNRNFPVGRRDCELDLGEGEKTIRIELPWSLITCLSRVELDDGATLSPVKPDKKVVFYGDSITQGYDTLDPSGSYASQVALHFGLEEFNYAVGGMHFRPDLVPLADDIEPDYVVCSYGANDWNSDTRETIVENSRNFYAAIAKKYPNAKRVFALAPIWRKIYLTEKPSGAFRDLPKIYADAIAPYPNMTLIDCFDFVKQDPAYFSDGVLHPNQEGFAIFGKNLIAAMEPYFNKD